MNDTQLDFSQRWPNLAEERLGARVLFATDDFFAGKENLVKPGRGIFDVDRYTDRGKWMDGWESRRKRDSGHDYADIRLGLPGCIQAFDIDTNHFLGNHPPEASVEGCFAPKGPDEKTNWFEVLPKSPLEPGSQNLFEVKPSEPCTHVRLHIYPDGGVARLRVYGDVHFNWDRQFDRAVNLIGMDHGARVLCVSDMFFGQKDNLIKPFRPISMRDGWESRRRRRPGHDWSVIKLGHRGVFDRFEIDTSFFKGNFPDRVSIESIDQENLDVDGIAKAAWRPMVAEQKLAAHHVLEVGGEDLLQKEAVTHLRFNIFPDGGVARLKGWGRAIR